jgi:hypothetical protein
LGRRSEGLSSCSIPNDPYKTKADNLAFLKLLGNIQDNGYGLKLLSRFVTRVPKRDHLVNVKLKQKPVK